MLPVDTHFSHRLMDMELFWVTESQILVSVFIFLKLTTYTIEENIQSGFIPRTNYNFLYWHMILVSQLWEAQRLESIIFLENINYIKHEILTMLKMKFRAKPK